MTLNKQFKPNPAQLRVMMLLMKIVINIWPRGQGKTNAIAWIVIQIIHALPKGTSTFVGRTYIDLFTNIIPEVKKGLAQRGYFEGVHYFDGKRPPEVMKFETPFVPIREFKNVLSFYTGHCIIFASQDREGANRGGSVDFIIVDEILNIKKDSFEKEILPKRRGNNEIFKHVPFHHGIFGCSSKPVGSDGAWVYEYGSYYKDLGCNYESMIRELTDVELEFIDTNDRNKRILLWESIQKIQKEIQWFPHKNVFYNECRVWNNIDNLSWQYIKEQRRIMSSTLFRVEVLNDYFGLLDKSFYAAFRESVHVDLDTYNYDYLTDDKIQAEKNKNNPLWYNDYNTNEPLILGQDYGVNINCILIAQRLDNRVNILKEFYVKAPLWTKDVIENFCEFYAQHKNKLIYYHHDHTGLNRQANAGRLADEVVGILQKHGWTVIRCTMPVAAPTHDTKFHLIHNVLSETDEKLISIRINGHTCPNLITSIKLAPVKQGRKGLEKDKSSENPKRAIPQEIATHFSDVFDMIIVGETQRVNLNLGYVFDTFIK